MQTVSVLDASGALLAPAQTLSTFEDGSYIIYQGEKGHTFYVVRDGRAEVTRIVDGTTESVSIAHLGNGDYFGEGALLSDKPLRTLRPQPTPSPRLQPRPRHVHRSAFEQRLLPPLHA